MKQTIGELIHAIIFSLFRFTYHRKWVDFTWVDRKKNIYASSTL